MTKILAAADIHGNAGLVKKLAEKAKKEKVDLIILAGDLTLADSSTKNIIGPLVKTKKPVLIMPGNHESITTIDYLNKKYKGTRNLHGSSFKLGDVGIFGSGTIDWGTSGIKSQELFYELKEGHDKIKDKKKKIMVTHMHPRGGKAEFSGFEGSIAVKKATKKFKPDILISAHIHEAEGIEHKIGKTKVIQVGKKGKIIEL